jgi:predicted amidophosphoribosyltransferase
VRLESGLVVAAAFHHHGAPRRLVHRLKYHGLVAAADLLSAAMVPLIPAGASALVPVPRATFRRLRHGVDPAILLAQRLSRRTGVPVVCSLRPGWWWPRHAIAAPAGRTPPRFRLRSDVPSDAVLVDDVLTTGATMGAAAALSGDFWHGLVATSPGRVILDGAQGVSDGSQANRR